MKLLLLGVLMALAVTNGLGENYPLMRFLKKKLDSRLDDYQTALESKLKPVSSLMDSINNRAIEIQNKVEDVARTIEERTLNQYSETAREADSLSISYYDCERSNTEKKTKSLEKDLSCIDREQSKAMTLYEQVTDEIDPLTLMVEEYREKGEECIGRVEGLVSALSADLCLKKLLIQFNAQRVSKNPYGLIHQNEISELRSIASSISRCSNGVLDSLWNAEFIGREINQCIRMKISRVRAAQNSQQNATELPSTNLNASTSSSSTPPTSSSVPPTTPSNPTS